MHYEKLRIKIEKLRNLRKQTTYMWWRFFFCPIS